ANESVLEGRGLYPAIVGQTDWERLRNMTEEEIEQNALDDPDSYPYTEEELEQIEPVVYRNFEEWRKAHEQK
ncbi:MAG: hypothetical protein ACOC2Z_17705, partial [Coleofasciculus sp.]